MLQTMPPQPAVCNLETRVHILGVHMGPFVGFLLLHVGAMFMETPNSPAAVQDSPVFGAGSSAARLISFKTPSILS